jgi:C-terminal processing protease CtpA/Prc
LNTFGQKPPPSVLEDLTNTPLAPQLQPSTVSMQPRNIPIRKDSQLSNGVGFNFRTVKNDASSDTPYSHIITSVDNTNAIGSQGLRVNDYILSINDENVEYLNHEQLEDKLRRINNSETIRLLVTDGNVYRAYKKNSENVRVNNVPTFPEQSKPLPNRRQYRLQRNPDFEGYGFRVRSNQQLDGTPHQIVSVEPYSPADIQGLRVGDYILRVNNQNVEHMNPSEFNYLMQNLVRNDSTRDGNLLLEVMDEDTYRSINHLPSFSQQFQPPIDVLTIDRHTPPRSSYDSLSDEPYPRMRQCFIRV